MSQFKVGDRVVHELGGMHKSPFRGVGIVSKQNEHLVAVFGPSEMETSRVQGYWSHYVSSQPVEDDGFEKLRDVYSAAVEQTKSGKGADRHGSGEAFEDQLIVAIGKHLGSNHFELGQAVKKLIESARLASRGEAAKAKSELLGALNYTAAAYLMLEDKG